MKKYSIKNKNTIPAKGFTLIEILISVALIAALSTLVFVSLKPAQRLAKARNNQRKADIAVIMNAMGQRAADNRGVFETGCTAGAVPTTTTPIANGSGNYDIAPCLVSTYLTDLPFDPKAPNSHYASNTDYITGYTISRDATTGRVTLAAPYAEVLEVVSVTR